MRGAAIVIDSAGIGSSIAANKVPGARAALCYDRATARNSREHNDANMLSLGAQADSAGSGARNPGGLAGDAVCRRAAPKARGQNSSAIEEAASQNPDAAAIRMGGAANSATRSAGWISSSSNKLIQAITEEILGYLGAEKCADLCGLEIDELVCPGCDERCAERCARKTRKVVEAGAARISAGAACGPIEADIARLIDHTLLKPEASRDEIRKTLRGSAEIWICLGVRESLERFAGGRAFARK